MKKYKFNKNEKKIIIQSSLMAGIMLITGCTQSENKQEITESTFDTSFTTESNITEPVFVENTATVMSTPVVYKFSWSADDSEEFANYIEEILGKPLKGYVRSFGFTDELNQLLTEYINNKYISNYESVPFSKVSYFHTYMVDKEYGYQKIRNDYDDFYNICLDSSKAHHGPFVNKLIMSYFYINEIPLGSRITFENLKALGADDLYSYDGVDSIINNGWWGLGNYDSSYVYSNYELLAAFEAYNTQIWKICNDERIKNLDILTNDSEFPQAAEAREIYNGFLREYYGFDNCPQFGEVVTREQYIQIFGEEPLDLSYIPGAVVKDSEVKGSARANTNGV